MATLRAVFNKTTRVAQVATSGTAVPGGSVLVGTFPHPDPVYPGSTVIFHGVRDLLYKRSAANPANNAMFPDNITDMANVEIALVRATAVIGAAAGGNLAVAATRQATATVTPAGAVNTGVTWEARNPDKATISPTGLITGVAAGVATFRVTTLDGVSGPVKHDFNVTIA